MSDMPYSIEVLEQNTAEWEAFVADAPDATFFHRAGWKQVIEQSFGHRCYFLQARRDGRLQAVLPLVHVKSRLFANALISTPFCVYGGAVAKEQAAAEALYQHACTLADRLGVEYLESRERRPRHEDWPRKDLYYTFARTIADNDEDNLKAIPRKQRAVVRKALKSGLDWRLDTATDTLYSLYLYNMRSLGTPPVARNYLDCLKSVFGDDCEILTVIGDGEPQASVLSFYFRDQVLPYYSGAGPNARDHKANDYLYWALMSHAAARGVKWFDFGRSKRDTGPYHFKRHWGFEPEPLPYEYYLAGIDEMPDLSPNNPKYALFIKAWQKLPLPLTRMIGPWLARDLG
ncbi:FemAB family XrtA/PEP-CTERM system-associated protein [Salinisphaera sp. T31B1]|uniref:FemAB family XrtA/PEP-CTERM system-associated protein n=1 Tax=Salinisphaera sp. T31B1 TaxID=727963 RepID=UPI00334120FE